MDNVTTVSIPCALEMSSHGKEYIFSVMPDGAVTMTLPPPVTECAGAAICFIEPRVFDTLCHLINNSDVRKSRGTEWANFGSSRDGSVRTMYDHCVDGIFVRFFWADKDGERSHGPEGLSWGDLAEVADLLPTLHARRRQSLPVFGL